MAAFLAEFSDVSELGKGGFATVSRAFSPTDGRTVALKYCLRHDERNKSLDYEMTLLQRLHHPNIVKCIGRVASDEYNVIKLEYIGGTSLNTSRRSGLEECILRELSFQIAIALNYIHSKDILHLDVTPSNILMTPHRTFQLIDFGISESPGLEIPDGASCTGKLGYTAPELEDFGMCGPPCDVYSLGMTLLNLILDSASMAKPLEERLGIVDCGRAYSDYFRGLCRRMLDECPKTRITAAGIIEALEKKLPTWSDTHPLGKVTVKFRSEESADQRFLRLSAAATVGDFLEAAEPNGRVCKSVLMSETVLDQSVKLATIPRDAVLKIVPLRLPAPDRPFGRKVKVKFVWEGSTDIQVTKVPESATMQDFLAAVVPGESRLSVKADGARLQPHERLSDWTDEILVISSTPFVQFAPT
jgi:serine/threonine protein kinase